MIRTHTGKLSLSTTLYDSCVNLRGILASSSLYSVAKLHWVKRRLGWRILHCLGDSHIEMFQFLGQSRRFQKTVFSCTPVGGATVLGIVNPNSKTNARDIFSKKLRAIPRKDYVLLMLGEVDCGFLIWYQAKKHGWSIEKQLELALANYRSFMISILEQGLSNLIICSAPLPTIPDGQEWGVVANLRREVTASIQERTSLTINFNSRLRILCDETGIGFLDFQEELLDRATQRIRGVFLNDDPLDHHLNNVQMAPLLSEKLHEMGFY